MRQVMSVACPSKWIATPGSRSMKIADSRFAALALLALLACEDRRPPSDAVKVHVEGARPAALVTPMFVQVAYATPQSSQSTVSTVPHTVAAVSASEARTAIKAIRRAIPSSSR
jgi:hypothetical protein